MNDDSAPLDATLASAYIDNAVDSADRAIVDGSPAVLAMADTFRSIRSELAGVAAAAHGVRDTAIAAALAHFDAAHLNTAAKPPVPIDELAAPRMRRLRLLSGVAAAAVVGVLGIVALNNSGSDNITSSESGGEGFDKSTPESAAAAQTIPDAPVPTIGVISGSADALQAVNSLEQLAVFVNANATFRAMNDTDSGMEIATDTTAAAAATTVPPSADSTAPQTTGVDDGCAAPSQKWLGDISYQGTIVAVYYDPAAGLAQAVEPASCTVVAEVTVNP